MGRGVMHIGAVALLIVCLFSLPSRAGENQTTVSDSLRGPALRYLMAPSAEWSGDSLVLRFSCVPEGRLKEAVSLHAVPLFIADGVTLSYPEVSFYTSSGARFLLRRQALSWNGGAGSSAGTGAVVSSRLNIVGRETPDSVLYREAIAVPSTLKGRLYIVQKVEDCCEEYVLAGRGVSVAVPERGLRSGIDGPVEDTVDVPLFSGDVTSIEPENETVKSRSLIAAVRLNYPVDRWEVYPDFENNASELRRLDSLLSPIIYNTDEYRLRGVTITGYASPEGTFIHNLKLSGKRADGIRDYLMKRYGLPSSLIVSVSGVGEDWDGLRSAVEEGDMPGKAEVLSIIDGYGIFDGRESRLLNMRGGQTYRRMLRDLFPPLRRVEVKLDYTVLPFSRREAEPGKDKADGEEAYVE